MSKYHDLIKSPPKITIKKDCREVIFTIISAMCDNVHTLRFKKDEEGDFKLNGMGYSLNNYSFKHEVYEMEWTADAGEWDKVIRMINSGTSVVEKAVSR